MTEQDQNPAGGINISGLLGEIRSGITAEFGEFLWQVALYGTGRIMISGTRKPDGVITLDIRCCPQERDEGFEDIKKGPEGPIKSLPRECAVLRGRGQAKQAWTREDF